MATKKLRPITPGQRYRIAPSFEEISKSRPEKSIVKGKSKSGGRNNYGKMTTRYVGGGHKRKFRPIDFKRDKYGIPAKVKAVEYDPNRSARVALLYYKDGEKRYILAPDGIKEGAEVISGENATPEVGNSLPLSKIPLGAIIHNVEMKPGQGGQMVRSAGAYAQLLAREGKYATLYLPSGEMRLVLSNCYATIGTVSNSDHMNVRLGKAGRKRWLGYRPRTRAVSMNPVDHPMGGGEGRKSGGHPRSRNGLYTKGLKTRKKKKSTNRLIIGKKKK